MRRRFTLAHELAHRVVELYLGPQVTEGIRGPRLRRLIDECASRILLPDSLLVLAAGAEAHSLELTIPWLDDMHRRVGVSISCLLKRLNDAAIESLVGLTNGAFLAAPDVSRRRQIDHAPRVVSSCVPCGWFIPANKRLSSLGLRSLPGLFWQAEPFEARAAEDTLTVSCNQKDGWRPFTLTAHFHYVIYQAEAGKRRCMLAVFSPR
jgi:hypothetical protein